MSPRSIHEYADQIRPRYLSTASRREKSRLLTEFCRVTGYYRKAAIRLLRGFPRARAVRGRGRPRSYGPPVVAALRTLWETSDYLCSKRLVPFLPELLRVLEHHGVLHLPPLVRRNLLALSPPTVDRLLKPFRRQPRRRVPLSRVPSALRAQVPIRTFGEWGNVRPGALQADLVLHCGETTAGFHLASLVTVDVATGWTECQPVWGLSFKRVGTAVHLVRQRLPFPLQELHTDNGQEFLNHILVPWCRQEGIRFTRGRPYRKNDQAYVEQKVWAVVRRLIGYDRYSSRAAYEHLAGLYALLSLYLNFFQPTAKVVAKIRRGARVTKRYDRAQTPYQRLRAIGLLAPDTQAELERRYLGLNPIRLREQIQEALGGLWKQAARLEK